MFPPIPRLEDYDISPEYGFLSASLPSQALPHPVYERWERIINNFQSLLLSKRLRSVIDHLPVIPTAHLHTEPEWRRAYSILAFLSHGYIWGGDKPAERLPPSLTYPLLQAAAHLAIPPVATYASLCLWNFKPIFLADPLSLDNLATLTTFTGSLDEQWFYLISVAMEARGGPTIPLMLRAIAAARANDADTVTKCLRKFAEALDELGSLLVRMYDSCDPHVFYHRIRPFLAGSKNMRDAGLPNGILYDDGSKHIIFRQYSGGSNAQSSLIQFFDIVLGVEHRPTVSSNTNESSTSESEADQPPGLAPKPRHNFLQEMRQYMPGAHRDFLQAVEVVANIREFVEFHQNNRPLCIAYDACLAMLRALRDKHIQMVSRYIIVKSRESRSISRGRGGGSAHSSATEGPSPNPAPKRGAGIAGIKYTPDVATGKLSKKQRGTGGTALIPFLKQARDETAEPMVDAWARRLMTGGRRTAADFEIEAESSRLRSLSMSMDEGGDVAVEEEPEIVGLAGSWNMEDNGGGLCAW